MTTSTSSPKSSETFDAIAEYYDLFYKDRNYIRDATLVYQLLGKPETMIEYGAGTGGCSVEFMAACELLAIEPSEAMAFIAHKKGVNVKIGQLDDTKHGLFDAACAMFSVVSYAAIGVSQQEPIRCLASNVKAGGCIAFDVPNLWADIDGFRSYGRYPQPPQPGNPNGGPTVTRCMSKSITKGSRLVEVEDRIDVYGEQHITINVRHKMSAYDPLDLERCLRQCGLKILSIIPMDAPSKPITRETTHILCVAEKL